MLYSKDIRERLKDIEEFLGDEYKKSREEKKRDWRTYEQQLGSRIKNAMANLEPLIEEAVSTLQVSKGPGRPHELTLKQRVTLLLVKELFGESNRMMSNMLLMFSLLSGIDVSYKTVERLYSDEEVELALHNLHVLILRKKGVKISDATGDGTGYSLTISRHYASDVEKRGEDAKAAETTKREDGKMAFVYTFRLLDLNSRMYIAYGSSMKSEKEAFDRAMEMQGRTGISLASVRLDKYYSFPSYVDRFGSAKVYVLPRKNATLNGSWKWKRTMKEFVDDTPEYLEEYYRREHSEAGFSADKRMLGWGVAQRLPRRIDCALTCAGLWHNLFNLDPN